MTSSSWAYFLYEFAGIPVTLLCGYLSDRFFKGYRAPASLVCMALVTVAVLVYWKNPAGNPWLDNLAMITIGFLVLLAACLGAIALLFMAWLEEIHRLKPS